MENLIYEKEAYDIVGICMEIHNELGSGFSEIVYKDALEHEFIERGITFSREQEYSVRYKNTILKHKFCADFVVMDKIILEVKTVSELTKIHQEQTINYLCVADMRLGLLINFRGASLQYKRLVY
jgi:GxxExxY protein